MDFDGSKSIPRYALDALGPNTVLGIHGNIKFHPFFIAYLIPPCNAEINNYLKSVLNVGLMLLRFLQPEACNPRARWEESSHSSR